MKKRLIAGLILLVSLAGCTSIPISPIVKERVLVADFDSTWEAALAALKEEKIPVSSADKQSGIIQTKTIKISGDVARAISQGYNETFDRPSEGTYRIRVRIKPKDKDRTSIRIVSSVEVKFLKYGWYVKSSSGILEEKIFVNVMRRLKQYELLNWQGD